MSDEKERRLEARRLRDYQESKERDFEAMKRPELPKGWDEHLLGYRMNDGTVGIDDDDKYEPVALVSTENPAARLYADRLVEHYTFYSSAVSSDDNGVTSVLTFTTGDDFLKSFLTADLTSAIIKELQSKWEYLRQNALIESVKARSVIKGVLDKDKVEKPLEKDNIYKPGFVKIAPISAGTVVVARFSRSLFGDTPHRLECLANIPRPTSELRRKAYYASGREGSNKCIAIPYQFWCTEVMRTRNAENATP